MSTIQEVTTEELVRRQLGEANTSILGVTSQVANAVESFDSQITTALDNINTIINTTIERVASTYANNNSLHVTAGDWHVETENIADPYEEEYDADIIVKCSSCDMEFKFENNSRFSEHTANFNYCPGCGVKMSSNLESILNDRLQAIRDQEEEEQERIREERDSRHRSRIASVVNSLPTDSNGNIDGGELLRNIGVVVHTSDQENSITNSNSIVDKIVLEQDNITYFVCPRCNGRVSSLTVQCSCGTRFSRLRE